MPGTDACQSNDGKFSPRLLAFTASRTVAPCGTDTTSSNTSRGAGEYATRAIDSYKKAYAVDPTSPIIGERLAEMYWKAQRVHEAVTEANEVLKRNPDDLPTHRLLALVYLRSLGDINGSNVQSESIVKAIQEYNAVHRLDPSDQEVTIWLARLYRLHNEPEKAESVLRDLLKDDPENDAGVEQLTQLLLDQNKAEEAISLLNGMIDRSPSPTLYDHLGERRQA